MQLVMALWLEGYRPPPYSANVMLCDYTFMYKVVQI